VWFGRKGKSKIRVIKFNNAEKLATSCSSPHSGQNPHLQLLLLLQYVPQPNEPNDPHDRQVFAAKCAIRDMAESIPYSVNGRNSRT
jgi:hypothetical protein